MSVRSVLVTGSSGAVGTALTERLLDRNYRVTGVDKRPNPWSDRVERHTECRDLLSDDFSIGDDDFDIIVHLAANSRVQSTIDDPSEATENGETTRRILEYARRNDIDYLLFASSREVYGAKEEIISEESTAGPRKCTNPYAASKLFGEALCRSYQRCYGLNTGILRFSNVYGRYDDHDRVIPLFIAKATAGEELTVYGEGKVLDFVYLDDCVAGIERAIKRAGQVSGEAVNIGSGRGTSLVEVAKRVADSIDACPGYNLGSERAGEPMKSVVDLSKSRALLDYTPKYQFEDGLAETAEWYRAHPELLDSLV